MSKKKADEKFAEISFSGFNNDEKPSEWANFEIVVDEAKAKQKRENNKALATHILAYFIVLTFILVVIYNTFTGSCKESSVPAYLVSIVSVVITFYFGGNLFQKN